MNLVVKDRFNKSYIATYETQKFKRITMPNKIPAKKGFNDYPQFPYQSEQTSNITMLPPRSMPVRKNILDIDDHELIKEIEVLGVKNNYRKGQNIFVQGGPAFGVFYLESGVFKISQLSKNGNECIIRLLRTGSIIGHEWLFDYGCHTTTATCLKNSTVVFLDYRVMKNLMDKSQAVSNFIYKSLINETQELREKYISRNQKNVRQRMASLLIELFEDEQRSSEENFAEKGFDLWLSRENLSSIIGTSCETAIRFLTEFRNENIISQIEKRIIINDLDRLLEYSKN